MSADHSNPTPARPDPAFPGPRRVMKWSDDFSIGIPEIDEDHKRLVQCLDDLFTACFAGQGPQVLSPILDRLMDYTRQHFSHEEDVMRKVGYPGLDDHRAEHAALVLELDDIIEQHRIGDTHELSNQTLQFLEDWLSHHILVEDKKIGRHAGAIE